mmetsp:Transcript_53132/g.172764  ORF Transcript_53132/g.172764 Transcript_53132/m.172764 type:complete len:256 (+) Transcript_53132:222-989(+)
MESDKPVPAHIATDRELAAASRHKQPAVGDAPRSAVHSEAAPADSPEIAPVRQLGFEVELEHVQSLERASARQPACDLGPEHVQNTAAAKAAEPVSETACLPSRPRRRRRRPPGPRRTPEVAAALPEPLLDAAPARQAHRLRARPAPRARDASPASELPPSPWAAPRALCPEGPPGAGEEVSMPWETEASPVCPGSAGRIASPATDRGRRCRAAARQNPAAPARGRPPRAAAAGRRRGSGARRERRAAAERSPPP